MKAVRKYDVHDNLKLDVILKAIWLAWWLIFLQAMFV